MTTPKRILFKRVVEELNLDTSDPFTLIFANAVALADLVDELRRAEKEATDYKALYHDLVYAVSNKWPGETRHKTALRYIMLAERGSNTPAQATAHSPSLGED